MHQNKFKITLYSKRWKEEIITYDFPNVLPLTGDLIEVIEEDAYFKVHSRIFKSEHNNADNLIPVILNGEIDGHDENTKRSKFDDIIKKIEYRMGEVSRELYLKTDA